MSRPNMRAAMPWVTQIIDDLREAFGKDEIDDVMRRGLWAGCKPHQRFFASEAGHSVGTRYLPTGHVVNGRDMVLALPIKEGSK